MGIVERRKDNVPEMKPTPRSARMGAIADALMAARNWADKAKVPEAVPLVGGQGLGSLVLGKAPEELTEMSYGNMPMRVNPLAGRTASYVPEMKPGRKEQVADLAMLAGTPKIGKAGVGLAGGVDDVGRAAIAYHGTPHKFAPEPELPLGRFRAEKIGSGEGQQMYGYGLYFAELPNVAGRYKSNLSLDKGVFDLVDKKTNQIIPENTSGFSLVKDQMKSYGRDLRDSDIKNFKDRWKETRKVYGERLNEVSELNKKYAGDKERLRIISDMRIDYINKIKELEEASLLIDKVKRQPAGSLYTVDIPDEMVGKMLDFDAPLSEQPESVQKMLRTLAEQDAKKYGDGGGLDYYAQDPDSYSGESLYKYLSEQEGGQKQASTFLQNQGVPGVRYFDEYSRAQGEGTRNIVVFPGEESKVKILKRDGDETKMAKGGMMNRSIPGFQDGGSAVEPTTGNDVPIGSLPNEVADDIPARLSEGEFVLPADVVRFIGLERLMKLRDEAKEGLRRMAEVGQMGNAEDVGEKAEESFEEEDTGKFESDIDEILSEVDSTEGQTEQAFAQGGAVGSQPWLSGFDMTKAPKNPVFDVRYYKHPDGRIMYVTFFNGKPMTPIPDGFTPTDKPVEQQVGKEAEEKKKTETTGMGDIDGGPGGAEATAPAGKDVTPTGPGGTLQLSDLAKGTTVSPTAVKAGALALSLATGLPFGLATTGKRAEEIAGFLTNQSGVMAGNTNIEAMGKVLGVDVNTPAGRNAAMAALDDLGMTAGLPEGAMTPGTIGPATAMSDYLESAQTAPSMTESTRSFSAPEPVAQSFPVTEQPSFISVDTTPSGTDSGYSGGNDGSLGVGSGSSDLLAKGGLVSKRQKPMKKTKGKGLASR